MKAPRRTLLACAALSAASLALPEPRAGAEEAPVFGLAIHGGAGRHSPDLEAECSAVLEEALDAGYAVLEGGGSALDAVAAAIVIMEDAPVFNAGRGAVFNAEGFCELDASVMDGRDRSAGAVAGVQRVRNPVLLARDVMERSRHVLLFGEGAERFAVECGHGLVDNEFFHTERRRLQLERARSGEGASAPGLPGGAEAFGTVGCVALDREGNLAAGTSTGGLSNKRFGRVGDSPIIGAGTYAANGVCAVSATGQGEFFIRASAAREVAVRMEHAGADPAGAAAAALGEVASLGGTGGLIVIDASGNVAVRYNTATMARAHRLSTGERVVAVLEPGEERIVDPEE